MTSISRKNGHENGIKLFRNLKNTVFDINHPNMHQKYLKTRIFYSARRDLSTGALFHQI
jgi:hypothetical protein